jgi:hypothetical protein
MAAARNCKVTSDNFQEVLNNIRGNYALKEVTKLYIY